MEIIEIEEADLDYFCPICGSEWGTEDNEHGDTIWKCYTCGHFEYLN